MSRAFTFTETDAGTKQKCIAALRRTSKKLNKNFIELAHKYWWAVYTTAKRLCLEMGAFDTGSLYNSIRLIWQYEPSGGMFEVAVSSAGVDMVAMIKVGGGTFINPKTGRIVDYACFTKNNFVISNPNVIQIPTLKLGDRIYSNGDFEKVTGVRERIYNGTFVKIFRHKSNMPLEVTQEHKISAIKSIICPYHKGYDYYCRPSCKYHHRKLPMYKWCREYEKYKIESIEAISLKVGDYLISPRLKKIVDRKIAKGLCRLIGYFVSDGNSWGKYYTRFSFTYPREQKYADNVNNLMKNVFGVVSSKPQISDGKIGLCFCNKKANKFFSQFYNDKKEKYLPQWILYLPHGKQKEIICGLFRGDAYKGTRRKRFVNTSRILAEQVRIILERLGFSPSFRIDKSYRKNHKNVFLVEITGEELIDFQKIIRDGVKLKLGKIRRKYCLVTDDYIAYPIRKIEKRYDNQRVWDVGVENTHLLTVNGNLVSNSAVHDGTRYMMARPFLTMAIAECEHILQALQQKNVDSALAEFVRDY